MTKVELKRCNEALGWIRDAHKMIARRDLVDTSDSVRMAEQALLKIPAIARSQKE